MWKIYKVVYVSQGMKFEFLSHTSEVKFRAYGRTLNEVFESVVLAFSSLVAGELEVLSKKRKKISVSGNDRESLLYNFIEELIYLFDADNFLVVQGKIHVSGNFLTAELFGGDSTVYSELEHVKAATYSEMEVKKFGGRWVAQAVVDV